MEQGGDDRHSESVTAEEQLEEERQDLLAFAGELRGDLISMGMWDLVAI